MAENKRSFILYTDILQMVEKLTDAKAGKLFKIILEYVNDKNPGVDELILQVAFEPIKQQLKRDLIDWEKKRHERSEAGKKGMAKRWKKGNKKDNCVIPVITKDNKNNTVINPITNITDNVTVNVTVNDIVCYDIEKTLLQNQIAFDKICIATQKMPDDVKTELHHYHLWLTKNSKYPGTEKALMAGIESWILNSAQFKRKNNFQAIEKSGPSLKTADQI